MYGIYLAVIFLGAVVAAVPSFLRRSSAFLLYCRRFSSELRREKCVFYVVAVVVTAPFCLFVPSWPKILYSWMHQSFVLAFYVLFILTIGTFFYVRPWKKKSHKSKRRVMPWRSSMKMRATRAHFQSSHKIRANLIRSYFFPGTTNSFVKKFFFPAASNNRTINFLFTVTFWMWHKEMGAVVCVCVRVSWFNLTGQFSFFGPFIKRYAFLYARVFVYTHLFLRFPLNVDLIEKLCDTFLTFLTLLWHRRAAIANGDYNEEQA